MLQSSPLQVESLSRPQNFMFGNVNKASRLHHRRHDGPSPTSQTAEYFKGPNRLKSSSGNSEYRAKTSDNKISTSKLLGCTQSIAIIAQASPCLPLALFAHCTSQASLITQKRGILAVLLQSLTSAANTRKQDQNSWQRSAPGSKCYAWSKVIATDKAPGYLAPMVQVPFDSIPTCACCRTKKGAGGWQESSPETGFSKELWKTCQF